MAPRSSRRSFEFALAKVRDRVERFGHFGAHTSKGRAGLIELVALPEAHERRAVELGLGVERDIGAAPTGQRT